jgi:hypothetical protein
MTTPMLLDTSPMPFYALGVDYDKVWERFTADGHILQHWCVCCL